MKLNIVITGANGFIGNYLTQYFAQQGHQVYALVHHLYKAPPPNITYRAFDLHSFASDVIPEGTDLVIHAAYIPYNKNNNEEDINYKASKRLLEMSRRKKVQQFIFFSSFSASENALSNYGQSKFKTEQLFNLNECLVLVPGLVVGPGGLYNNIKNIIQANKFIPLIANGNQVLQYIRIEDLAEVIEQAVNNNIVGRYVLACEQTIKMKDFYKKIANDINKHIFLMPMPYFVADLLFQFFDKLNIDIGISRESLLGLKQMEYKKIDNCESIFHYKLKSLF